MSLKCLLSYLLIAAVAIIPLPSQTLAQHKSEMDGFLNNFDLLLLQKHQKDTTQSILLVSENTPSTKLLISLPPLQHESEYYVRVIPDINSDTVYWSTNTGSLGYFRIHSKEFGVLVAAGEQKITDLTYALNTLYWVEDAAAIKLMQLGSGAEILVEERDSVIRGLAVDSKTGTIYYSTSSKSPRSKATIWSMTSSKTKTPIASDALVPTAMSISDTHVHWISNPPGMYFFIQRLTLNGDGKSSVIVRQPHQHGSTLAVTCNKVLWTNSVDDSVWEANRNERSMVSGRQGGYELLGEYSEWEFLEVYSTRGCSEDASMGVPVTRATTTRISTSTTQTPSQETSTESASSSSESLETEAPRVSQRIRVCSPVERESCTVGDVCVVIGGMKPLCLSQQHSTKTPHITDSSTQPPELNSTAQPLQSNPERRTTSSWPPEVIIIISVLSTLATVMSLISLYMTIRVRSLSRKPIIRRRVVVSTRTSESGSSSPASVCEMIDIENCCNMNVCETPCYERTLLQPNAPNTTSTCTQSTTTNGNTLVSVNSSNSTWGGCGKSTKEDKRCLLR